MTSAAPAAVPSGAGRAIEVQGRTIAAGAPLFVVGELSGNHGGSLERALGIVEAVAVAGASAVKLQTYTADTITIDCSAPAFRLRDDHELWGGRNLHDLYSEAQTPWEWHRPLFQRAHQLGLVAFSSPFDPSAVAFLEELDCPLYKVASAELVDRPLLREIARTGKPVMVSTGMASLAEIDQAVTALRQAGTAELVLLVCQAAYPARPQDVRLANLELLSRAFDCPVGLSDHSLGIGVAVAAAALGAVCVEKHVTLDRHDGAVDSAFSASPAELAQLVEAVEQARLSSRAPAGFGPSEAEAAVWGLRRSLFVTTAVAAGDEVTADNVRSIRPSGGLDPDQLGLVLGRRFRRAVAAGTPLTWDLV
ncbi:MAG: pseudaminic acid synthase [Propionibacteriaceae bacterium]|jgi:N-acetylneuraminate synthase|nr:pseudaminic acid synthase [Propionibacteriaceae bacterium]